MKTNTAINAEGGRNASRAHREQLVRGKAALPPAIERTRNGERNATIANAATPTVTPVALAPVAAAALKNSAASSVSSISAQGGREASRARRTALVQGKTAVRQLAAQTTASAETKAAPTTNTVPTSTTSENSLAAASRQIAQAMRAMRAKNGRGDAAAARPSAHVRNVTPLNYAPKVTASETYAGGKVTGVRIGRGMNVTGDERGVSMQVTGSQYIGKETGFQPRAGGIKVGACRTTGGLVVTGTQVRSKVSITGDESGNNVRITGEADQGIGDDLLDRGEAGAYTNMQFQRQHNPHGHTVFGTNLGRSAKAVGSRDRVRERAIEQTDGGLPISGTALGRSVRVTGDEDGSCRAITGDQYLMPANKQPLCATSAGERTRAGVAMGMNGRPESQSWSRNRITGVDVEHNDDVTGDEYGACSSITGTPYVGPAQYEAVCPTGAPTMTQPTAGCRVTGDTPLHVDHVTGTHRGCERSITGTPYYRETLADEKRDDVLAHIKVRFSVRSPQREAQLRADAKAVEAPTATGRITGSFAVGQGKITGNQEFNFNPRAKGERAGRVQLTGEGRVDGPGITGSAWTEHGNVTGTEGYIATERNPSERSGKPHGFASSAAFKGKGRHEEPRKNVTGMAGWSSKTAARVTLSGGAHG